MDDEPLKRGKQGRISVTDNEQMRVLLKSIPNEDLRNEWILVKVFSPESKLERAFINCECGLFQEDGGKKG
jgi:hypothetical protein